MVRVTHSGGYAGNILRVDLTTGGTERVLTEEGTGLPFSKGLTNLPAFCISRPCDILNTHAGSCCKMISRENMKVRILIEQDEDGIFIAECPSLPGCVSQGKTRNEAIENIQDAIRGYLESLKKHDEPIPPSIDEEIVEVAL